MCDCVTLLLSVPCSFCFWHGTIPTVHHTLIADRPSGASMSRGDFYREGGSPLERSSSRSRDERAEVYTRVRTRSTCNRKFYISMAAYYTELAAKTWISPSKGTKLLLYRKDHVRSK